MIKIVYKFFAHDTLQKCMYFSKNISVFQLQNSKERQFVQKSWKQMSLCFFQRFRVFFNLKRGQKQRRTMYNIKKKLNRKVVKREKCV